MSNIIRYDGTRFITEEEIDKEFTNQWVLVKLLEDEDAPFRDGYLIASTEDTPENRWDLEEIAFNELDCRYATLIYGCAERGVNLHVELLG